MEETREFAAVSGDDKVSIDLRLDKVSVSATGDVVGSAGSKIGDVLSPITESLGLLGDVVRLKRQEVAVKGISRVNEITKERGLKLEPVPPKFLTRWVEGISLESDGGPLFEMWSQLFVAAASEGKFSGNNLVFMRILREITVREAEVLINFCSRTVEKLPDDEDRWFEEDFTQAGYYLSKEAKLQMNPDSYFWPEVERMSIEEAHDFLIVHLRRRSFGVAQFFSSTYGKREPHDDAHTDLSYVDEFISSAELDGVTNLLKSLNLIDTASLSHVMAAPKYEFYTNIYFPLPVAFDLLRQCLGDKYSQDLYKVPE